MGKTYPASVAVTEQHEYNPEKIAEIISGHFKALGIGRDFFAGKKVVIKPNLVMKKPPEFAATTHPAVIEGLLSVLSEMNCTPVIAESPGGVYSAARLEGMYRVCGLDAPAEKYGATLNYDTGSRQIGFDGGRIVKSFDIITPVADADVIIDVCKLKSHSLTVMSAAVKNLFGTIPGIEKFEAHTAYPDYGDFSAMLCDLCFMHCETKKLISITDAIVGMEGNGPTAGEAREIGCIITSENPFASDLLAASLLGFGSDVSTVRESISRGLCPDSADKLDIIGKLPPPPENFKPSDANKGSRAGLLLFFSQGKLGRMFMPRPAVSFDECRGCGECARSCPQKMISLSERDGRKVAEINYSGCIRCYCCQELCPIGAIKIRRNFFIGLVSKIK